MPCADILAVIGGLTVAFYLLKLTWRCWCGFREFVLSAKWQVDLRAYGQWADFSAHLGQACFRSPERKLNAEKQRSIFMLHVSGANSQRSAVVTGATSGIGKAYAIELARRGLDVVLISRCDNKLQLVAREIEDAYGRRTQTIPVDFTHGYSIYPAIAKTLQSLQIGILVNNVGMTSTNGFAYFLETPDAEQKITQVINCNILSVPQMTRLVLPDMVKRGKGLIINISSTAGVHPQPLLTLYSATKTFVTYFSQCLHAEYKSKGITVQCVTPLLVSTNMTKNVKVNSFMKNAAAFAREALNTVGHSSCTAGCLSHALQNAVLTTLLPDRLRMSTFLIRKLRRSCKKKREDQ